MHAAPESPFPGRDAIEWEVRRLAPWYYRFHLGGVSTDATAPCDHHGHRDVGLPAGMERLLDGRTVLDVACNEGAYAFAALDHGARRVDAFDCRAVNVEKARFVARVLGHDRVAFHVATCASWLERPRQPVDWVFLCGILYHLPDPEEVIRRYCALAREGVYATSLLHGGEDGYTASAEADTIASAEDPDTTAMVPNTTETLLCAFAREGFHPLHVAEGPVEGHFGGCALLLLRRPGWREAPAPAAEAGALAVHLLPMGACRGGEVDLAIVLRNRTPRHQAARGALRVLDASGAPFARQGPQPVRLGPRYPAVPGSSSTVVWVKVPLPAGAEGSRIEVVLEGEEGTAAAAIERQA